jgi:FMN phosphatase YigB (HAD superfamily)
MVHLSFEMSFEFSMCQFFGNKADGITGEANNKKFRKQWLLKATKAMLRRVNKIETTTRHKKLLMSEIEHLSEKIKESDEASWEIIFRLFSLCSRLLGYDYHRGAIYNTPIYHQTQGQYYNAKIFEEGGDALQHYYDNKDAISARKEVINDLKAKGYDDFKVALILNTTEYQIKKLRKNL